jgi:hypothetical protein
MWELISGALSAVIAPVTTIVQGWQARQSAQLQSDLKVHEAQTQAKINLLQTQQTADIAWENLALEKAGWRTGYITVVFTIPAILCFVPGAVPLVQAGFAALDQTPVWYQSIVGGVVAAALGLKHFADFMSLKKGA